MPKRNSKSEEKDISATRSLVISNKDRTKLTPTQIAFNKLTEKIEKLQKEIERKNAQFDLALKIFGTELYPAEQELIKQGQQLIVALWDIYKMNKLSKTDQRSLKDVVKFHLYQAVEIGMLPEELHEIFFEIEGETYKSFLQRQEDIRRAHLKQVFRNAKINFEEKDLDNEEIIAKKFAQAKDKIFEKDAAEEYRYQNKKSKTAKQELFEVAQKENDQAKQKNISSVYKQLAKLFHPDLEQDETMKAEKEVMMKELIAAYDAKDLHTLLGLELKWIHKETAHLAELAEEKLIAYITILREQEKELEAQKRSIFFQPRYAVLANTFGQNIQRHPVEFIKQRLSLAKETFNTLKTDVEDFKSAFALRYVKQMLKDIRQQQFE